MARCVCVCVSVFTLNLAPCLNQYFALGFYFWKDVSMSPNLCFSSCHFDLKQLFCIDFMFFFGFPFDMEIEWIPLKN